MRDISDDYPFFRRDKRELSEEEEILEIIGRAPQAISFEDVLSGISNKYISRQSLRQLLNTMEGEGKVKRKIYTITYSTDPLIRSVIAEVYFVRDEQREIFEAKTLPEIRRRSQKELT